MHTVHYIKVRTVGQLGIEKIRNIFVFHFKKYTLVVACNGIENPVTEIPIPIEFQMMDVYP